jgi:hypothetical protein
MMEGKECGGSHTNEPRTSHMSHTHTHTYTHTHEREPDHDPREKTREGSPHDLILRITARAGPVTTAIWRIPK